MLQIVDWLNASIPVDPRYILWALNAAVGIFCLFTLWLINYSIRRALGFYRFRGVWYNQKQFGLILERAYDDWMHKSIMDVEERDLVEKYILHRSGKAIRSAMRHKVNF